VVDRGLPVSFDGTFKVTDPLPLPDTTLGVIHLFTVNPLNDGMITTTHDEFDVTVSV